MASDRRAGGRLEDHPDQPRAAFGRARRMDACCRTCLCSCALDPTRVAKSSPLRHQRHRAQRAIRRSPEGHRELARAGVVPVRPCGSELEQARDGSLGEVFDHVGIAVWDLGPTDRVHPLTRGLHVGFRAPSREAVDAFWQAGIDAGYRDDGAPGPRTIYGPDYYGGFLLDPGGNSAEAGHTKREDPVPDGRVDHLWIRVRDPAASKRFYTTIASHAGLRIGVDEPDHVQVVGENFSFSLIDDERPLTEHVHLAFPAQDDATVRAFHAAALAAGYEDHGCPGERAVYHPGYYGAFVLDPDGHNVEVVNHNR